MLVVGSWFEHYKQPGQETRLLVETSAHLLLRSVHRFNGLDDFEAAGYRKRYYRQVIALNHASTSLRAWSLA
jgi:hypothetical protein